MARGSSEDPGDPQIDAVVWMDGWMDAMIHQRTAQSQQHCCQSKQEAGVMRYRATAWLISHYGEV